MDSETAGLRYDYLGHKNTMTLRFLMIAAIFIFHAGLHYSFLVPLHGYTCVSIFFFLSGFGLEYSLDRKEGYMRTFLQKRTLGLLVQYMLIMLYCAALTGLVFLSADVFVHDAKEYMFNYTNWFIVEMLVFYTLFFVSAMMEDPRIRMAFLVASTVLAMYTMSVGYGTDLYYTSGATFVFGILWYRHKDAIDSFVSRFYIPLFLVLSILLLFPQRDPVHYVDLIYTSLTGILTATVTCIVLMADLKRRWYVPLIAIVVGFLFMYTYWDVQRTSNILLEGASMLFLAGISCILYQLPRVSKVTAGLGAMSLELFLLHYITYGWSEYFTGSDSMAVILTVSAAITLVISFVAYKLIGRLMKAYSRGIDRISGCGQTE